VAVVVRRFRADADSVFRVLADGWLYACWMMGASRTRAVDRGFPTTGTALHHSSGAWPFVVNDATSVEEWDPPHRIVLVAQGKLFGAARAEIRVSARASGCVVRMTERPVNGAASLVPSFLMQPILYLRNVEALRRLDYLAAGNAAAPSRA
jgi:hypothetical protein